MSVLCRMAHDLDVPQFSNEHPELQRPKRFRSLATKFSIFTAVLVFWVVATILAYDLRQDAFDPTKGLLLFLVVVLVAATIARFTMRLLARPLSLLEAGIHSVSRGKLEPIQISKTGDEIEFLGESFNRMIDTLASSKEEIQEYHELLEQRIRQRTEELEESTLSAQAASQAKSEFLANMSHELRTPMNGVIGMLDITLESKLGVEQREQIETAQRCAYSLLALLNDILDLSKIEAGKMVLERIAFDIRAMLEDCIRAQYPRASQNGVIVTREIAANVPVEVVGDPLRIRQIIANLVSNAVKFTEKGSVRIRLESAANKDGDLFLHLKVTDTGTGIPADKLPLIFDKFTQADGSVSRKYGGTGLGLAIAKKLVEMHGGEIHVESEVGVGTTFFVSFKCGVSLLTAARVTEAIAQSHAVQNGDRPLRILVVEDNAVNQKVVTTVLRKRGFAIELARDGREALDKLTEESQFDLVLMDVQMPVLDGLETTRLIRQNPRWDHLPIIAMTAHAMIGDRERCLEAGMSGYVSKPVHPSHLLSVIDEHLLVHK
jgi:signal transduction histidine kinase/ActR/RegA family two-component response regulator